LPKAEGLFTIEPGIARSVRGGEKVIFVLHWKRSDQLFTGYANQRFGRRDAFTLPSDRGKGPREKARRKLDARGVVCGGGITTSQVILQ